MVVCFWLHVLLFSSLCYSINSVDCVIVLLWYCVILVVWCLIVGCLFCLLLIFILLLGGW